MDTMDGHMDTAIRPMQVKWGSGEVPRIAAAVAAVAAPHREYGSLRSREPAQPAQLVEEPSLISLIAVELEGGSDSERWPLLCALDHVDIMWTSGPEECRKWKCPEQSQKKGIIVIIVCLPLAGQPVNLQPILPIFLWRVNSAISAVSHQPLLFLLLAPLSR